MKFIEAYKIDFKTIVFLNPYQVVTVSKHKLSDFLQKSSGWGEYATIIHTSDKGSYYSNRTVEELVRKASNLMT